MHVKAEYQHWMAVTFDHSGGAALKADIVLKWISPRGLRNTSENHRQLTQFYIYKRKLKLYHAKRKPFINNTQKRQRLLWAPSSSEMETCAVV